VVQRRQSRNAHKRAARRAAVDQIVSGRVGADQQIARFRIGDAGQGGRRIGADGQSKTLMIARGIRPHVIEGRAAIGVIERADLTRIAVDGLGALIVGDRAQKPELPDLAGPAVGRQQGEARIVSAAVLVIGVLKRQGQAAFLEVKRTSRDQIDRGAQRTLVRLGVGGLLNLQ